ncbi:MAG TPA: BTAD domain-containing putative transcriptional regulator [Kineosporiaceae bacterium]|nr:BTAD domain-containing putative transcriptional regulator [Kineosporiaceae bacterium]
MLTISVLGPVEVRHDGERLVMPAGKTTEVLIRLALDSETAVSADRLIEDLWGAEASGTERNTLQAKISKLRRALGTAVEVSGGRFGYALQVRPSAVDAVEVLQVAEAATSRLRAGDLAAALECCRRGLAMFTSETVLSDAGDRDWVIPYRVRLEEVRLGLIEDQLAARALSGAGGELLGELEALVVLHPLRERLWELLVAALYRSGRQADALATYRRVKFRLAEELGLDPGPQLQRLEQQILVHDAALHVRGDVDVLSLADARVGNLPSMVTDLVGRRSDLEALTDMLARERLVEIVGPGGVGKTALAIAVGHRLAQADGVAQGGIWLARLETAVTPEDVVDALIAALGVPGDESALAERLRNTEAVVILDNCEHVLDAVAQLVVRLLDAAPRLRVLCTSQIRLDVEGEFVFDLAPLPLSAAAELFTRRAAGHENSLRADASGDAVVGLCRALDGLPLAIELAAARTRTLSIEEITRRLGDRFAVLSDPGSRRPERRRSLESTIQWSYELLFPDDQRGLWALATFAGGGPLPAVEFVLEALDVPATAAIDVVGRLASRSLLIVDTENTTVRYRLLDSIRAFAVKRMAEAGHSERALAAHATWFADAAVPSTAGVRSGRQAEYLAFARAERANLDAALAWSIVHDEALAIDLVNGFGWAWIVLGDSRGADRIVAALDAAENAGLADAERRANALLLAAWIEASTGHVQRADDHIAAAAGLAEALGDVDLQARCCYYLAYVVSHQGEFERAIQLTDRSRALYDRLDRPWDQVANALFAARASISAGDEARSVSAAADVLHWLGAVEDPWMHVRSDAMLGELARLQHRFDDAVTYIARAAQTSRRLGFVQTEAYQVASLGRAQCQTGDYDAGVTTLRLAVDKSEAAGDVRLAALVRVHLGRVLRALGQVADARAALQAAADWHRRAGGGEQAALGECLLAAMDAVDRVPGAETRLAMTLDDARRRNDAPVEVFALDALARLAVRAGDPSTARDLRRTADRRMKDASHFITDRDRTDAHAAGQVS